MRGSKITGISLLAAAFLLYLFWEDTKDHDGSIRFDDLTKRALSLMAIFTDSVIDLISFTISALIFKNLASMFGLDEKINEYLRRKTKEKYSDTIIDNLIGEIFRENNSENNNDTDAQEGES